MHVSISMPWQDRPLYSFGTKYILLRSCDYGSHCCNEIMECGTSEDAGYDIEPESLYLHVLPANQAEEYQHIRTYQKLGQFAAILPTCS